MAQQLFLLIKCCCLLLPSAAEALLLLAVATALHDMTPVAAAIDIAACWQTSAHLIVYLQI
jgi:hypothetical protein